MLAERHWVGVSGGHFQKSAGRATIELQYFNIRRIIHSKHRLHILVLLFACISADLYLINCEESKYFINKRKSYIGPQCFASHTKVQFTMAAMNSVSRAQKGSRRFWFHDVDEFCPYALVTASSRVSHLLSAVRSVTCQIWLMLDVYFL